MNKVPVLCRFVALMLVLLAPLVGQQLNWVQSPVNGHLYALTPPMGWNQAEAVAVANGGHLVTVRNSVEHAWIVNTFQPNNIWIGLSDQVTEGTWVWASGEPVTFTAWSSGQPDNLANQDYAYFWNAPFGSWDDHWDHSFQGLIEVSRSSLSSYSVSRIATVGGPLNVSMHALGLLPAGGCIIFGGQTPNGAQPFTYTIASSIWSQQFPNLNPAIRSNHTLILDVQRGNNLLFGGRNPIGVALDDTWTYASGQWAFLPQSLKPVARSGHRMAYDTARNLGVLFGGKDGSGAALGDQWTWSGTAWTLASPAALPPARFDHGLAYDSLRDRMVCFGGSDGVARRNDVWESDGTTWVLIAPTPQQGGFVFQPEVRDGFGMAYDPRAERSVIFGGETAQGCRSDVWSWDGQAWTLHVASAGSSVPSARRGLSLIHDPAANQLVLFAGGCGTTYTNDLWTLELPTYWRSNSYGVGCQGSSGQQLALGINQGSTGTLGSTLQMQLTNVPVFFSISYGALGFNRTSFNGLPLPLDLAILGLPGCAAYNSADLSYPLGLPNTSGTASWNLAIPNLSFLLGTEIYLQGLSFEAPGFTRWATVSNGLVVRLGNQ